MLQFVLPIPPVASGCQMLWSEGGRSRRPSCVGVIGELGQNLTLRVWLHVKINPGCEFKAD